MPKSVTEIVTEIVTESHRESQRYDRSTGMELPTVWGNVRCIDVKYEKDCKEKRREKERNVGD